MELLITGVKNIQKTNPRVSGTNNGKTMMLSKCATCGSKKSKFIKNQEAKGLLSNLGLRTPLSIRWYFVLKCNLVESIKWME